MRDRPVFDSPTKNRCKTRLTSQPVASYATHDSHCPQRIPARTANDETPPGRAAPVAVVTHPATAGFGANQWSDDQQVRLLQQLTSQPAVRAALCSPSRPFQASIPLPAPFPVSHQSHNAPIKSVRYISYTDGIPKRTDGRTDRRTDGQTSPSTYASQQTLCHYDSHNPHQRISDRGLESVADLKGAPRRGITVTTLYVQPKGRGFDSRSGR